MGTALKTLVLFALVAAIYLSGGLGFVDRTIGDLRFRLLERDATGDLAVVAIDPASLDAVGVWPWPRSFHAQLLSMLDAMGVGRVAYDIDFSTQSTQLQDQALEDALAAHGESVILPTFRQFAAPSDPQKVINALPLPRFARHATLASINVRPDSDGNIRRIEPVQDFGDLLFPFMGVRLAARDVARAEPFYIDYGIRPETIPVYSFIDVILGQIPHNELSGRDIIVGSTAIELGDQLAAPRHKALPGVFVQALAYEAVVQGRMLKNVPAWLVLCLTPATGGIGVLVMLQAGWRRSTLVMIGIVFGAPAISLALQSAFPVMLDTSPLILMVLLGYGLALLGTIGRQAETIKLTSQEASRWQRRMAAVLENSFDAIVSIGRGGEVRSLSRSAVRQFGPEDTTRPRTLKELMPLPPGAAPGSADNEALGRRADGSYFTAEVSVSDVDDDERLAVVRDNTERKLLEREADRYLNISQDLIAVLDENGRILRLNPTWQKTLGHPSEALVGTNLGVLLSGIDGQKFRDLLEEGPERDSTAAFEARLDTRSGQPKWFSWVISFSGEGETIFVSGRDVSERRRIDAMKDQFVTSISQNLLMPLTAMRGLIKALNNEEENLIDKPRLISLASQNTERLIRIVSEVVQMQRLEAGEIELVSKPVSIGQLCRRVIAESDIHAQEGSVAVALTDHSGGAAVYGDEDQLEQVVSILLSHAIEAAPPGTTASILLEADGPSVKISVRDEGPGIPMSERQTLFEPFGSASATAKSGLGLGLAKGLVERHRGTIAFQTEDGKGTTFFVTLPAEDTNVVAFEPRDQSRLH